MHYEFCLTEWRDGAPDAHDERCVHVRLNDADLVAKIEAAYEYRELRDEVDQALAIGGQEYFREECLRRLDGWTPLETSCKPQYEVWGEQRVAEGKYKSVLRFREHMLPVLLALRSHAFLGAAVRSEPIRAVNLVDMELSLP
jgi:hypothetical protein